MINEILSNTYEHNVNQQQQASIDPQQQQKSSQSTSGIKQEINWDGTGGKKYRCDLCGIGLSAFGSIKRHKDAVHYGLRKKFIERECPICHKSYFQLQKHIKIKHKECKIKCGICDRVLSCSFSYKRHLKKVHGYYKGNSSEGEAPAGIKIENKNKEMDFSGFSSSSAESSGYKKPELPYGPIPPFVDPMIAPRIDPPPPPTAETSSPFHPLMPGMYPPPFTPFKREFPSVPNHQHQSGSSGAQMMPGAYGAPPYESPSPYPYTPFYMNDQRSALLKNGTKELANILGIESGSIQGSYVQGINSTQGTPTATATGSSINTCSICGNSFKDASSLRRHTRIKHASKFQEMEDSKAESKKYKCHICNVSLSCSGSIQRHVRLMHNKVGTQQAEKDHPDFPYPCPVCHRSFANEISLQRHASYHKKTGEIAPDTNISSYTTCAPCDRGFDSNFSYERHLIQHTPNPPPQGKICNVCNLVVTTSMSLRRHKKLKHAELYTAEENLKAELELKKRYKCELCNKPIASYSSLQRHIKLVHNKVKQEGSVSPLEMIPIKTELGADGYSHDQPNNLSLTRTPITFSS